jgi:hypothetical protein
MNGLFNDFFIHKKGQLPNEELKELFKEVLGSQTENN